jgi:hypothetical protein
MGTTVFVAEAHHFRGKREQCTRQRMQRACLRCAIQQMPPWHDIEPGPRVALLWGCVMINNHIPVFVVVVQ